MVKSSFGHIHRNKDGLLTGQARPQKRENMYSRLSPTNRKAGTRERTAIIMLRRKGYTYNQLSVAFQRSTSYIYMACRNAISRGTLVYRNFKVGTPFKTKMFCCGSRLRTLLRRFSMWQAFISGATDKPP
jgi:hypothetical protein